MCVYVYIYIYIDRKPNCIVLKALFEESLLSMTYNMVRIAL